VAASVAWQLFQGSKMITSMWCKNSAGGWSLYRRNKEQNFLERFRYYLVVTGQFKTGDLLIASQNPNPDTAKDSSAPASES